MKAGFERKFYDLGKHNYWGPQSRNKVDFHFDDTRKIAKAQMDDWQAAADRAAQARARREGGFASACGGGTDAPSEYDDAAAKPSQVLPLPAASNAP